MSFSRTRHYIPYVAPVSLSFCLLQPVCSSMDVEMLTASPFTSASLSISSPALRLKQELLQRYNPTAGITEEERIRLTARRVGLDVPITHDASSSSSSTSTASDNYRESAKIAQDKYKQDKDHREDQLYSGKGDGLNVGGPLRPPVSKE